MITVKELQARRKLNVAQIMEEINKKVIAADDTGQREVRLDVDRHHTSTISQIVAELRVAGYIVRQIHGNYGQTSTNPYHHMYISWE